MTKRMLCALLCALIALCGAALAAEDGGRVTFDEGFSLALPDGWKYYTVEETAAEQGVLYCMSDANAGRWMYVQRWDDACADMDALLQLVRQSVATASAGVYRFGDTDFVVYEPKEGNISCCATLLNGEILNFVVTPQNDADYMLMAAEIFTSFKPAE